MTKSLNALIPKGNNRKKFKMPSILRTRSKYVKASLSDNYQHVILPRFHEHQT